MHTKKLELILTKKSHMRISLSAALFVKGTSLSFAKRNVSCAYLISLFNKLRARVRLTLPFYSACYTNMSLI